MAGSPFTLTDLFHRGPVNHEATTDLDSQKNTVEENDIVYPGVTEIITMNLKDVLDLKIDSLKNAILFLKNFPKCCSIKTEHDERAKYEPWTNRKDIFFTKLGITPYISNPDDKNNKKEYNQWHLETVKLAGELIKDYSVVSFYKAIADADMKGMSEVSWFLKTLEQSLKAKKLINLTSRGIRKGKRKVRRKAA